jgi:hypothetical protein
MQRHQTADADVVLDDAHAVRGLLGFVHGVSVRRAGRLPTLPRFFHTAVMSPPRFPRLLNASPLSEVRYPLSVNGDS